MRGIERGLIVGIIIVILVIIVVMYFILPVKGTGEKMPTMRDFYYYCAFWSQDYYKGTTARLPGGGEVDMRPYCKIAIGHDLTTPEDWENCRKKCMGANITT